MDWAGIIGPGAAVAVITAIGGVWVARTGKANDLPSRYQALLDGQAAAALEQKRRLDAVEEYLVVLGDHVDVLEAWIWEKKPPPPPPRPRFRPYREGSDA